MYNLRPFLIRFTQDTRGAVFIMVAFGITALLASVGLAVEASHYMQMKSKVRNALDQALIAAASTSSDVGVMQTTMNKFFAANMGSTDGVQITRLVVSKSTATNSWVADVDVTVATNFAGIMGVDSLDLHHEAAVKWDDNKQKEIVAMLDISGTMCATFDRKEGVATGFMSDPNCLKLQKMREALKKIVDIGVSAGEARPIYKLGIVPFTYKVRLPNPWAVDSIAPYLLTNEVSKDYYTNMVDAEQGSRIDGEIRHVPMPTVKPLRNIVTDADIQAYKDDVDSLFTNDLARNEFSRPFMKRSSLGAHISALMLDPRYHGLFGGAMPNPIGMKNNEKIVIIMTDSANLGCCYTSFKSDFRNNYLYSYRDDVSHLVGDSEREVGGICKQMHDAQYTVFTVLLDVAPEDTNEPSGKRAIEAFEQCATEGNNYRIPLNDQKALEEAYKQIGAKIKHLRLTY